MQQALINIIQKTVKQPITNITAVGGGCINATYKVTFATATYFCKVATSASLDFFDKEKEALLFLKGHASFKIPQPFHVIKNKTTQVLLMEFIESHTETSVFWEQAGICLAQQHLVSNKDFGWHCDNYIGSLRQKNDFRNSWSRFFVENRLLPLLQKARNFNLIDATTLQVFEQLFTKLSSIFPEEPPALLHGDLWRGNIMNSNGDVPVIFDPAIYFGHREQDLAMTKLFGGFPAEFYDAYNSVYPLEKNWQQRLAVYNLYPLLVHLVLFGTSYLYDIKTILKRFQ